MWTPRRILLVVVGLVFFATAYGVYAYFLGFVDGLPTLPPQYAERAKYDPKTAPTVPADGNPTAQRIRQAFGPTAPELRYNIKADSKAKGLLVVAHDMVKSDTKGDGRVTLTPCSVAIFGKGRGPKGELEITTMHCDRAILQFDGPVDKWSDMEGRKIVAAELRADPDVPLYHPHKGIVRITNNRKSYDPDELLEMRTPGPIFYVAEPEAGKPHVWTDNVLEVTDRGNLPKGEANDLHLPTMTAKGMKLYLSHEPKDGKEPKPKDAKDGKKQNQQAITGVERVELLSDVEMNLWVESGTSFLSGSAPKKPEPKVEPKDAPKKERSIVQILTHGSFLYDMPSDKARFDRATHIPAEIPNYVQVTRKIVGSPNRDIMTSDYLELQFRRKTPAAKTPPGTPSPMSPSLPKEPKDAKKDDDQITIDTVHAWGTTVVVSSDSEEITAYCNDLTHDNAKQQTVLSGERVIAVKEGNQIAAKEMILNGADSKGNQSARVKGPGQIDIGQVNPITKEFVYTRQALWDEWLTFDRIKEQGHDVDVLTLTGNARFADKPGDQFISARQLKVWTNPAEKPDPKSDKPKPKEDSAKKDGLPKVRLNRMEATGDVTAHSPEIDVRKTDYLNVFFKEVASLPGEEIKPVVTTDPAPTIAPNPTAPAILTSNQPGNNPLTPPSVPSPMNPGVPAPKGPAKKNPPIELTARRIETWVLMSPTKNDLDRVHCEEKVVVHQDGTEDSPTGIDLDGKTLDLEHKPEGNILVVTGTADKPGEVRFDKVHLIGEEITIDQLTNIASVKGPGTVRMLSATDLRGEKLKEAKPLVVHWRDAMEFRGADQSILFDGKVQATQDDAKVLCESMQVMLDRVVWINHLKKPKADPAKKEDTTPKVDRVICDQQPKQVDPGGVLSPVTMIEETREKGKIVKYNYLAARELDLDNLTRKLVVPGPGVVRIMQLGSKEGLGDQTAEKKQPQGQPAKKQGPPEQEMKLTHVEFTRQMQARTNTNPQWARFFGATEVFHFPSEDPDAKFDRNRLPDRGIRLKCKDELIVLTQKETGSDGKPVTYQNLEARGSVEVWTEDIKADASVVKYDQSRDTITFEGDRSLPAVVLQQVQKGVAPKRTAADKIIYNRRTREITGENGRTFSQ